MTYREAEEIVKARVRKYLNTKGHQKLQRKHVARAIWLLVVNSPKPGESESHACTLFDHQPEPYEPTKGRYRPCAGVHERIEDQPSLVAIREIDEQAKAHLG